jgi:hypothetical protein
MSHTLVKFAFALVVGSVSLVASFAQPAGVAATRDAPITTPDASAVGKCRQGSPTTAGTSASAEFTHPGGVCWAPQDITDDPGA